MAASVPASAAAAAMRAAPEVFRNEVTAGGYPGAAESISMKPEEVERLTELLD